MIELNLREKWVDQMYGGNLTTWCIWIVHAIEAIRSPDEKEIEINSFSPPADINSNELRKPHPELGFTSVHLYYTHLPELDKFLINTLKGILERNKILLCESTNRSITIRIY